MTPDDNKTNISDSLKAARKKLEISQTAMAERIGVTLRTLQRYENGTSSPEGPTLARIQKALGLLGHDDTVVGCAVFLETWRTAPTPWHTWVMEQAMRVAAAYVSLMEDNDGFNDALWLLEDVIVHLDEPGKGGASLGASPQVIDWLGQLKKDPTEPRKALVEKAISLAAARMKFAAPGYSENVFAETFNASIRFFAFGQAAVRADDLLA